MRLGQASPIVLGLRAASNHPFPFMESKLTKTAIFVLRSGRLSVLILHAFRFPFGPKGSFDSDFVTIENRPIKTQDFKVFDFQ